MQGECDASDPYYDYDGTLRCLMEGKGDVAFTKHEAIEEYAKGGDEAQDWASLAADDLRLVCPGGGCASTDDYAKCNWGLVRGLTGGYRGTQTPTP